MSPIRYEWQVKYRRPGWARHTANYRRFDSATAALGFIRRLTSDTHGERGAGPPEIVWVKRRPVGTWEDASLNPLETT